MITPFSIFYTNVMRYTIHPQYIHITRKGADIFLTTEAIYNGKFAFYKNAIPKDGE